MKYWHQIVYVAIIEVIGRYPKNTTQSVNASVYFFLDKKTKNHYYPGVVDTRNRNPF